MSPPSWKLPAGVSRGTWDYLQSPSIANDYDAYFDKHPLMGLDVPFITDRLPPVVDGQPPPVIADLGCGTGRVSRALSPLGYHLINVDLSQHMLDQLMKQTEHPERNTCIQANLVELECLQPQSLDMAVCLFSSMGMIRGRANRVRFLTSLRPALKPGASLILHVHNRYHSLRDPSGPGWLLASKWKSLWNKESEFGDRVYAYRGLPTMFLHIYSRRELQRDLAKAGYRRSQFYPINATGNALLKVPLAATVRAGGYFVVAHESA